MIKTTLKGENEKLFLDMNERENKKKNRDSKSEKIIYFLLKAFRKLGFSDGNFYCFVVPKLIQQKNNTSAFFPFNLIGRFDHKVFLMKVWKIKSFFKAKKTFQSKSIKKSYWNF